MLFSSVCGCIPTHFGYKITTNFSYMQIILRFFSISSVFLLHMSKKSSTFANDMKRYLFIMVCAMVCVACNRPSRVEQYKAEKHKMDSIHLTEQLRTLAYYQAQLDTLLPQADSLLPLFQYEKNEKYQDHGVYVVKNSQLTIHNSQLRVMVRDDGRDLLVYKEGKRLSEERVNELKVNGNEAVLRAEHLQIVIRDTKELEKRIAHTSLEVQKYEKRLQK